MDWPNFIEPENHIVSSLISRRLGTQETSGFIGLDDRVPDAFSEAYYSLESSEQQPTTLKISYTLWGSFDRPGILGQAKLEAQQRFKEIVTFIEPRKGCDLTMQLDLPLLSSHISKASIVTHLSSMYALVVGTPLREIFRRVASGKSLSRPPKAVQADSNKVFYVKEGHGGPESAAVIFPIYMQQRVDGVLATAFVQEFAAAKTATHAAGAPKCYFSTAKQPPPELNGVEVSPCGGPVGGYLTFVISQRHLAKDQQLETAVWAMLSFYAVIAYHVKSYKATMHAKMRKKAQSMIQILNRARPNAMKEDAASLGP